MRETRLQLKHASGWFAAGCEVRQAATLLSDSAFKLLSGSACMQNGTQAGFGLRSPIWLDPYRKPNPRSTSASTSWCAPGSAGAIRPVRSRSRNAFGPTNATCPEPKPMTRRRMSPPYGGSFCATAASPVPFPLPTSDWRPTGAAAAFPSSVSSGRFTWESLANTSPWSITEREHQSPPSVTSST